jgi:hypothetical protein
LSDGNGSTLKRPEDNLPPCVLTRDPKEKGESDQDRSVK